MKHTITPEPPTPAPPRHAVKLDPALAFNTASDALAVFTAAAEAHYKANPLNDTGYYLSSLRLASNERLYITLNITRFPK